MYGDCHGFVSNLISLSMISLSIFPLSMIPLSMILLSMIPLPINSLSLILLSMILLSSSYTRIWAFLSKMGNSLLKSVKKERFRDSREWESEWWNIWFCLIMYSVYSLIDDGSTFGDNVFCLYIDWWRLNIWFGIPGLKKLLSGVLKKQKQLTGNSHSTAFVFLDHAVIIKRTVAKALHG